MPNPALTPGEAFGGVTAAQVCTAGWASAHRDVSTSEKEAVFAEYHLSYSDHASYEVDHLISLELGGDNSIKNLWPELDDHPRPGYLNTKDILENRLHDLVCSGQLALASAQSQIATDWWAAYQRYVGTSSRSSSAPASTPTTAPSTTQSPATTAPPGTAAKVYRAGEFCSPPGATTTDSHGAPMTCKVASDGRYRWEHN